MTADSGHPQSIIVLKVVKNKGKKKFDKKKVSEGINKMNQPEKRCFFCAFLQDINKKIGRAPGQTLLSPGPGPGLDLPSGNF